jgi:hypothetical protein
MWVIGWFPGSLKHTPSVEPRTVAHAITLRAYGGLAGEVDKNWSGFRLGEPSAMYGLGRRIVDGFL